jgi:tRNA A37 threonylcarbamoyladenosine dehydratase
MVWAALLLAYNAVRRMISVAGASTRTDPVRLSFTSALERVRDTLNEMMRAPTRKLLACYNRMIKQIARNKVPKRPGRKNERAVKIKLSQYPVKRKRCS